MSTTVQERARQSISAVFGDNDVAANVRLGMQAGAAGMVIAGAGPWVVKSSDAVEITKMPAAPPLILCAGIAILVLSARHHRGQSGPKALRWITGLGAVCALASVGVFASINSASSHAFGLVHAGWGVYVSFVASIATAGCATLLLLGPAASDRGNRRYDEKS